MKTYVPEYIQEAYQQQGITGLLFAIHTDMTLDADFADVYAAVDAKNLYILYGEERIVRTAGARRIVADYRVDRLETLPLEHLGELRTEKLLSTGRLIGGDPKPDGSKENEKSENLVLLYTLGYLGFVEKLIKVVKNLSEGQDPLYEVLVDDDLFCQKCGTRYPEPDRKLCPKCMDKTTLTLRLLQFFKYYKGQVALIVLMMIVSTGLTIASPIVGTQMFLDDVLTYGGQFYGAVAFMVGMLIIVRALNTAVNILYSYVLARIMPWMIYDLKLRIFEAMQRLSVGFYTSKRTGNLMNRVNRDANNIYWFFVDGAPFLFVNILMFIGVITLMFILDARLATIAVVVIPLCVFLFKMLFRFFRRYHHKDWVYNSQMNSMVSDAVNGQRVIKAFARESEEVDRFTMAGGKQAGIEKKMFNMGFTAFPLIFLLMFVGQIIVTAVGGIMVINGEMSLGVFMTFIAYLTMLYGPLE
ncbi:MAG: ABC transporter transmembrane domain-containing protein, partial [Defluviitaleaceae bacterium]|nr:ABC transporter transmembrane domain-containing protein [Defluviitaleaceae bacterium]